MSDIPVEVRASTPLAHWSPEVEILAALYDRMGDLINATIVASGGKSQKVKPWPAPVLASHRVDAARRRASVDDMVSQLWPEGDGR